MATPQESLPYLAWAFRPVPILTVFGRSAVLEPSCNKNDAVYFAWRDIPRMSSVVKCFCKCVSPYVCICFCFKSNTTRSTSGCQRGFDGIVWQPICSQNLLQPKCSQNLLQSLRVVWRTASGVTVAPGNVVAEKLLGYIRSIVCCRRTEHSFSGPFGAIYVRSQTLP